jgi:hypothetical protein
LVYRHDDIVPSASSHTTFFRSGGFNRKIIEDTKALIAPAAPPMSGSSGTRASPARAPAPVIASEKKGAFAAPATEGCCTTLRTTSPAISGTAVTEVSIPTTPARNYNKHRLAFREVMKKIKIKLNVLHKLACDQEFFFLQGGDT